MSQAGSASGGGGGGGNTPITGTGTTVGATTADIITITPTNLKSFSIQGLVTGYDTVNNQMIGGEIIGNGRKSGTTSIVGIPDTTRDQDAALSAGGFTLVASGGNVILRVTGVAGRTINWSVELSFITSP